MTSRAKRRQRYFWHEKREIFRFVHALHKRRWAYVVLFTPYIPIHLVKNAPEKSKTNFEFSRQLVNKIESLT